MSDRSAAVPDRWRRAVAYLRGAPATLVYTFTVLVTWYSLGTVDEPGLAHHLLRLESTNAVNMAADPVRVLVASAFWIESPVFPVLTTGGLLLVLVPAERALGTRRAVPVFVLGHVVASVLTVAAIVLAVRHGLLPTRVTQATDVGVSYGAAAVTGCAVFRLPRRAWRLAALGLLVVVLGSFAVVRHTFTDLGHVVALAVGVACWPGVRRWLAHSARGSAAQVGVEEPQDAAPGVLGRRPVVSESGDPLQ